MKEIFIDIDSYNSGEIVTTEFNNNAEIYKLILTKDNKRVNLTNKNVRMAYALMGTNKGDILDLEILNGDLGELRLAITEELSKQEGYYNCQIAIYGQDNFKEHTTPFSFIVKESLFKRISGEIVNDENFKALDNALNKVDDYNRKFADKTNKIEELYQARLNEIAKRVESITLNVKDFGAVGDGRTDDTEAFKAAIDSANINDSTTIFVPDGSYLVSKIVLKQGITLMGNGMNSKLFLKEGSKEEAFITNIIPENTHALDIHIKNLLIWGNPNSVADGIRLKGTYLSSIENCKIAEFVGNGVSIYGVQNGDEWIRYNTNCIKDCYILYNGGYGVFSDGSGEDFHVQGGDIGGNKLGNIIFFSSSSSITGVKAIWGSKEGNGVTIDATNVQVVNNNIEGNYKASLEIWGDNCFVEGNKFSGDSLEEEYKYAAIEIRERADNASILSNQILGDLYKNSILSGIRNLGTNTSIYSNDMSINPRNPTEKLDPVITTKPINSDYSWIRTNVMCKASSDIEVPAHTSFVLPLNPTIDTEKNIDNNTFVAKHNGIYTFKLTALVNSPVVGETTSSIKIKDNKNRVYTLVVTSWGTVNFCVDIEMNKGEGLFFYVESNNPATFIKEHFNFSVRKAIM